MGPSIDAVMRDLAGVAHIQDLLAAGFTRYEVARLHRTGKIYRPRVGWYVACWHTSEVVTAVRVGGVLGCISAAKSYGCSVPGDPRTHVVLAHNAARLRSSTDGFINIAAPTDSGVVRHWATSPPSERFRTGLVPALEHVLGCVDPVWAIGVVDSARSRTESRSPLLSSSAFAGLSAGVSADKRRLLALSSDRAESILESVTRVRLRQLGFAVEEQRPIGRYRADLVVEDQVVVECDGYAFHGDRESFERDRRRDAAFVALGYPVLRISYRRATEDWPAVVAELESVLARDRSRIR